MKEKATFLSKLYTKGIQYRPDTCDIDIIKGQNVYRELLLKDCTVLDIG